MTRSIASARALFFLTCLVVAAGCQLIATADRDLLNTGGQGGTPAGTGDGGGGAPGGGGMAPDCEMPNDCDPGNDCEEPTCDAGTCGLTPAAEGLPCSQNNGQVCDGEGNCVECTMDGDCTGTDVCDMANNVCVPEPCTNGVLDGMETDVDCGGPDCGACVNGDDCLDPTDCQSNFCMSGGTGGGGTGGAGAMGVCAACTDNLECGATEYCETGVCVAKNPNGTACTLDRECSSDQCIDGFCCDTLCDGTCESCGLTGSEGTCSPYTQGQDPENECAPDTCSGSSSCQCDDGVVNGNETGTDCGGGTCPACGAGQGCTQGSDCLSGVCTGMQCQAPACGDGQQQAGEGCDDGNMSNDDDCPDDVANGGNCQPATCGDGFVDLQGPVTEACDGNGMGTPGETASCDADCTLVVCGDGTLNTTAGEGCDDGDLDNTDDCPDDGANGGTCQPATCGDGFVDGEGGVTEACDGDGAGTPGETATCDTDCTLAACGDGTTNATAGETCDDGDLDNTDDCPDDAANGGTCLVAFCGDGFVDGEGGVTEACDGDGAGTPGETAACDTDCTLATCGDGTLNATAGEQCDDGNANDNDDCPDDLGTCQDATCSDGFAHTQGTGDETDVDCGGSTCGTCAIGQNCSVPADCTSGVCTGGVCAAPAPTVVMVSPADAGSDVPVTDDVVITFSEAMDPTTLTGKTTLDNGACTGSVQVSTDDFTTCIPFSSGTAAMSAGDTVATFTPAPGLAFGSTFDIRVTTAAESAAMVALASPFDTSSGFTTALSASPCDSVVISQVYGGGGNSGATFTHDFVELHNRGTTTFDVTGWAIQYASATGSTWTVNALNGTIPPGGYYLVQLASGGANGSPLPTPDDTGTSNLSGSNGKVALTSNTTALSGTCPTGGAIEDFVGYGATASCFEGTGPTLALTNTTSAQRDGAGCDDTDDNVVDFTTAVPVPRNSSTAALTCCAPTVANESGDADEADFCNVQFPTSITMAAAGSTQVFGQIFEAGVTEAAGDPGTITAELGYGPRTANPQHEAGWTFIPAAYNVQSGNNDEFEATLSGLAAGTYGYAFRFSLDGGTSWTYCDVNGAGSNGGLDFETPQIPEMTVTP